MANRPYETRVYVRKQCLLSEPNDISAVAPELLGALAAIFVPLLIGKAISGISAALRKAGSEKTLRDSGRLPTYLYRLSRQEGKNVLSLNPDLGAVIIVRGVFSKPDDQTIPNLTFSTPGVFLDPDDTDKRIRRLNENGIPVTEIAAAYEARIIRSDDETALRYETRFFELNQYQDSADKRTVVVTIALQGAGDKEGEPTLSLAMINLGEIRTGTVLGPDQLGSRRSAWLGGLGITDGSLKAIEKISFPANKASLGIMPVTVEGMFAETEAANKALLFIADVLDATKDDVAKTVSAEILKDRNKQATEAADAVEKLRQEEETAYALYLKAKIAEAELVAGADPAKANSVRFEVERTKRAWCLKFQALKNLGVPVVRADTCP